MVMMILHIQGWDAMCIFLNSRRQMQCRHMTLFRGVMPKMLELTILARLFMRAESRCHIPEPLEHEQA